MEKNVKEIEIINNIIGEIQIVLDKTIDEINESSQKAQQLFDETIQTKIQAKELEMETIIQDKIRKITENPIESHKFQPKINDFIVHKDQVLSLLREKTEKELDRIIEVYNGKLKELENTISESFQIINAYQKECQETATKIMEENASQPEVVLKLLEEQNILRRNKYLELRDTHVGILNSTKELIAGINQEMELSINALVVSTQQKYNEMLGTFINNILDISE